MNNISIIVAMADSRAIGIDGNLPFHISEDLRHFKAVTMGKPVIMGRKTFESLPGGALPGRRNIVVTRNPDYEAPGAETVGSLAQAVTLVKDDDEAFVIGGGEIYAQALPLCSRLHITRVETSVPGADTFFPEINPEEWVTESVSEVKTDPRNGLTYRFTCLSRK